ncbi:YeeE/YedE family protein [Rubellimicrobium roseum]|uniref:YeeE/YedE family protein n=1 Tax=Rubellimicrobium roseum TaxID=687525 RepID=A0A5C4NBF0_9RHOB|nr:YeeE/YedE family protein [Rubellimicrobium roseum]TNC62547.1 YeeE/YedE family protein [Rubellimicrobium roseum]
MSIHVQFFLGLLFGLGLVVAGMSDPAKVLNFLDLAAIPSGTWDPSLAFVLLAATAVTFVGYRLVLRRPKPVFDTQFHLPHKTRIEAPVIVGPAIFGIGWGLVGLCPGPAFTALGTGRPEALLFVTAMLLGMVAARLLALRQINAFPVRA